MLYDYSASTGASNDRVDGIGSVNAVSVQGVRPIIPPFAYWATENGYKYGEPETRPSDITNPDDALGATCKHLDLLLSNKRWLTKAASVVNAFIKAYPDKAANYLYDTYSAPDAEEDEVKDDETQKDTPEDDSKTDKSTETEKTDDQEKDEGR